MESAGIDDAHQRRADDNAGLNTYDGGGLVNRTGIHEHDAAYGTTNHYRGNVRTRVTPGRTVNYTYDIGGSMVSANDGQGHWVDTTQESGTNYAVPTMMTPNSTSNLASSYGYDAAFAPTSATSPGYGTTSAVYDRAGRPTRTTGVFGAQTNYTYTANETVATTDVQTATGTQTRYTRTTVDGLGRTVRATVGTASQTYSIVDTEYAACACSPLGKVRRVSQPYAPGGAVRWTTNSYDAMGRTTRVDLPDGSYSTYVYQGNTTTITDPAGKWKKYTVDAMGNLVQVTEPAPEGGTHETSYAYNLLGQLTTVTMPRGGHTQTRTFNYDLTTGRLMSATNPENGTVSYTYNADGTMATKTDAKAQRTEYTYDTFQRVSQVRYYAGGEERTCERVDYTYATNGTLEQVTWGGAACSPGTLTEYFGYGAGGKLTSTNVVVTSPERTYGAGANFGWTNEGQLSTVDYPVRRVPNYETGGWLEHRDRFRHVYDVLGRPVGLKWRQTMNGSWPEVDYVKDVSYGGAGELLSLKYLAAGPSMAKWYTETRTYNDRLQLTRMTAQPDYAPYPRVDLEYRYPVGQNAGRISQMKDWVTGEEISYQYDSLNRLISALTTGPEWGLSFAYDGFGNLTNQAVTKGSAPSLAVAVDPATNRMVGQSYDANGNLLAVGGYDVANRMTVQGGMQQYSYDPYNRKVWTRHSSGGGTLHLYGPSGELLGDFLLDWMDPEGIPKGPAYVYFGGRRLLTEYGGGSAAATITDRLASGRVTHESHPYPNYTPTYHSSSYYPYGETRTGPGSLFATYTGKGNLRYAMNRWYSSQFGRFTTPDPYQGSAGPANPQSWNRYAYVQGDPVNGNDPSGLCAIMYFGFTIGPVNCFGSTPGSSWTSAPTGLSNQAILNTGFGNEGLANELAYSSNVNTIFLNNAAYAFQADAEEQQRTAVGSSIDYGDGTGRHDWSITFTTYDSDGNTLEQSVLDDNTPIVLGAVPSLRSVTPAIYAVYQGFNQYGQRYIGVTNDLSRRALEHARNGIAVVQRPILTGVDYITAKGAEQALIYQYGLSNLANRINSIAPTNPLSAPALSAGCIALRASGFQIPCP